MHRYINVAWAMGRLICSSKFGPLFSSVHCSLLNEVACQILLVCATKCYLYLDRSLVSFSGKHGIAHLVFGKKSQAFFQSYSPWKTPQLENVIEQNDEQFKIRFSATEKSRNPEKSRITTFENCLLDSSHLVCHFQKVTSWLKCP